MKFELVNGYHRLVEYLIRGEREVPVKVSGNAEWKPPGKMDLFKPNWNERYFGMEDFIEIYQLKRL